MAKTKKDRSENGVFFIFASVKMDQTDRSIEPLLVLSQDLRIIESLNGRTIQRRT